MKMYSIKHRNGNYMPEFKNRGSSNWNGEYFPDVKLFYEKRLAKAAVTNWLKGEIHPAYDGEGRYAGMRISPRPDRLPDDIKITTVTIVFGE